jgi:hypothetical protein
MAFIPCLVSAVASLKLSNHGEQSFESFYKTSARSGLISPSAATVRKNACTVGSESIGPTEASTVNCGHQEQEQLQRQPAVSHSSAAVAAAKSAPPPTSAQTTKSPPAAFTPSPVATAVTSVLPAEGIIPHLLPRPYGEQKQFLENEQIIGQINVKKYFDHYCDLLLYAPMNGACIHCGDTGIKQCCEWKPPKMVYRMDDWPLFVQGLLVRCGRTSCGKTMMTYDPQYIQSLHLGLQPSHFTALERSAAFFSPYLLAVIRDVDTTVELAAQLYHIHLMTLYVHTLRVYQE